MDILKRIDLAQQFCKQYADGAWSIEKDKWDYHVTPEFIEDIRQNIESLHLKLMYLQTQQAKREVCESESYDMIDRYLRNNLYDDDYESYSDALDEVAAGAQAQPLTDEQIEAMFLAHKKAICQLPSGTEGVDEYRRYLVRMIEAAHGIGGSV
jgi:hypothetical protein